MNLFLYKQYSLIYWGILLFCFPDYTASGQSLSGQDQNIRVNDTLSAKKDFRYREDQFYAGLTFNFLDNMPSGVRQSGFSGGVHVGFIRDFPVNRKRNVSLGAGLGWSINTYRTNLLISRDEQGASVFQVLDRETYDYKFNRFGTQLVELPLEFRWRTSTADSYQFWRIYGGVRLGYIYYFRSNFKQSDRRISVSDPDGLNRFRYGLSLTFGYNTFNFTAYYSLNSFFDARTVDGAPVELNTFKVGLMFYIL